MAEAQGFEPWMGLHPCWFSRPVHSTALPRFRTISWCFVESRHVLAKHFHLAKCIRTVFNGFILIMSFFSASKLIWPLITPSNFLVLGLLLSLCLMVFCQSRLRQVGQYGVIFFAAVFIVLMVVPIGYWGMSKWERQIETSALPAHVDGIID